MKTTTFCAFILFLQFSATAQPSASGDFWQPKSTLHSLTGQMASEPAVFIEDNRSIDYHDNEKGELALYKSIHRIIRVNTDDGIERFNKVYLPGGAFNTVISFKARTILPNGQVINVDSSELKDYTDEDGDMYRIFALPGLEKGSELEYTYTWLPADPSLFGTEVIQSRVPVISSRISITSPERLVFEGRTFNGQPVSVDTASGGNRLLRFHYSGLAAAESEKYASVNAQVLRLEYKLSYNNATNKGVRLFTWNELAKRVYNNYTSLSEKEVRKAADLAQELKLAKLPGTMQKVTTLEHYVKQNIMVRKDLSDDSRAMVDMILKNRMASELGIMRLYGAVLEYLGISFQFVLAGDRTQYEMDRAFENWNNADNPLIFLTETGKYLAPTRPDFRYPWIAPEWTNTLGLHMKGTSLGSVRTAIAEMRLIPQEDYLSSYANIDARIVIVPAKDSLLADIRQSYGGYSASTYRAAFNFAPEEEQRDFLKEMVRFGTNSERIISSRLINKEFEAYNVNNPFVIEASVRADELMEKAGNKILLKVGEIIGPQVELYQEKSRVFPVDMVYPHTLNRVIHIEIPKGYRIKNPEAVNIRQVYPATGEAEMQFVSAYTLEGSSLKVTIMEEYRRTTYPLSVFDDFRKIINASADFNKVVLVLEPEK